MQKMSFEPSGAQVDEVRAICEKIAEGFIRMGRAILANRRRLLKELFPPERKPWNRKRKRI